MISSGYTCKIFNTVEEIMNSIKGILFICFRYNLENNRFPNKNWHDNYFDDIWAQKQTDKIVDFIIKSFSYKFMDYVWV